MSSPNGSLGSVNLRSEQGVIEALRLITTGAISVREKRELRDLVFNYTSSGGDEQIRIQLQNRLENLSLVNSHLAQDATFDKKPESENETPKHAVTNSASAPNRLEQAIVDAGSSKDLKNNSVTIVKKINSILDERDNNKLLNNSPFLNSGRSVGKFGAKARLVTQNIATSVADKNEIENKINNIPPVNPFTIPASSKEPTPIVMDNEPVDVNFSNKENSILTSGQNNPIKPIVPVMPQETPVISDADLEKYRLRIAEIKQRVNSAFGNPVNLVEKQNQLGRSYMSTLLDAMKALSGSGLSIIDKMNSLEKVMAEIELIIANPVSLVSDLPTNPTEQINQSSPVTADNSNNRENWGNNVPVTIHKEINPVIAPVVPASSTNSANSTNPITVERVLNKMPSSSSVDMLRPLVSPVSRSVPLTDHNHDTEINVQESSGQATVFTMPVAPVIAVNGLKTPKDLPSTAELKAMSGVVDPLYESEIDSGLEQLLSEWSLFKKSGLFGSGPRGRSHPLFIQMCSIPMTLIVAGRYEGATPEVNQSVTDYMNGWRYEQGIVYDANENFEHYLRRVIKHILDLQIKRRSA